MIRNGEHARAWEQDYRTRGERWGGAVHDLPSIGDCGRILEVGCGNGKTLAAIAADNADVVGMDCSATAVALARQSVCRATHLLVADARVLPFRGGSYGAVCAFHVLGHMEEQDRRLAAGELARVLRDGGFLYFRGFSTEDMRCGKGTETEPASYRRGDGILTHYFTEAELVDLFSSLVPVRLLTRTWPLKIRGTAYLRSEIEGIFQKELPVPEG
jgi:ubiquinone/menaquinone biosynthesis C-methylase UbiE